MDFFTSWYWLGGMAVLLIGLIVVFIMLQKKGKDN